MTPAHAAYELTVSAIDLTRSCTEHECYLAWLQLHTTALGGFAGIAHYLFLATAAFEERVHAQSGDPFDPYIARENLADILIASTPLSCGELAAAVALAIEEASEDITLLEQPLLQQRPARKTGSVTQEGGQ